MVDEKKLRLMTEVEMIKRQNKRELFNRRTFFAADFVAFGAIKAFFGATLAYAMLVCIIFLSQADELLVSTDVEGLIRLGINYIYIYGLILIAAIPLSILQQVKLYHKAGRKMLEYKKALVELGEEYEGKSFEE